MKKVTKETHLQLLLIILLIAAVILMVQNPFNKKAAVLTPKPSPLPYVAKPMSQEAKDLKATLVKTDKYYGNLKVYDNEEFSVNYDISMENFKVTIKKEPYQQIKSKAEEWFMGKGFKEFDLCALGIKFGPEKVFDSALSPKDTVFDRCPVPGVDEEATESAVNN